MITKEEITIKVPSEVAVAYRNATEFDNKEDSINYAAIYKQHVCYQVREK